MMKAFITQFRLPILFALYPVVFLYSNNVSILTINSITRPLLAAVLLALIFYAISFLFSRRRYQAANSAFVCLFFFFTYGPVDSLLRKYDFIQVERFTLFPIFIVLTVYALIFIQRSNKKNGKRINRVSTIMVSGLLLVNLVTIIPAEIQKFQANKISPQSTGITAAISGNDPDIYYLVFDEFASFRTIAEHWKYEDADRFKNYLISRDFYVIEGSSGNTPHTLVEMASRLNFREYAADEEIPVLSDAIANNQVMALLKERGYTTVIFDGIRSGYGIATKGPMLADYDFSYDAASSDRTLLAVDSFTQMALDLTIIRAIFPYPLANNIDLIAHRNSVLYTLAKIPSLAEVETPKFVYAHILLPHPPFIFNADGSAVDAIHHTNWDFYLGHYIYATKKVEQLVEEIFANSDPSNPPIIILQSDHGPRNWNQGYPQAMKLEILNAVYLPQAEPSIDTHLLRQPINTFPVILNAVFEVDLPISSENP
jgi:glycopeptide antibiotics resistance protein